nr:uncharacterized protein LOC113475437 [Ciona intestinalis]|eukprot:XP_026695408.1 uncharacterized protein LOC113475437 [Ciona intestinalis]
MKSKLHNVLRNFQMKVDIARQTLNHNVACALEDIAGADGTAEFKQLFHKWFTIINSKRPITDLKDENLLWLKDHFIPYLMEWRSEVTNMHPGEEKRILAKQTFEGLLFSTNNILPLTKQLLHYIDGVPLGNLTQDCLEAMFGNLRQYMHRNTNPDISQVGYGINALSKRRIISKIKGGNTTGSHGAINAWTKVCNDPLGKRKKKT